MTGPSARIREAQRSDGTIDVVNLVKILEISLADLAACTDAHLSSLSEREAHDSPDIQSKLGELVSVLEIVEPWFTKPRMAYGWYRTQALPSFGGQTAENLVKTGYKSSLQSHLKRIADGGYA